MIGDDLVVDIAGAMTVGTPAIMVRGSDPAGGRRLDDADQRVLDSVDG
jgi:hypothetical protein